MTTSAIFLLLLGAIFLVFYKRNTIGAHSVGSGRFLFFILVIALLLLLAWFAIMIFDVGPAMKNL